MGTNKPYGKEYLLRLQNSGVLSRTLKRYTTYKFVISNSKGRCLDFGCGDLTFLKFAKDCINGTNMHWFGHDTNLEIEIMANSIGVSYIKALYEDDSFFDTILCDNVLEHIQDWRATLLMLFAKLNLEGCIIVGLPGIKGYHHDVTHRTFITRHDIENFCNIAGFKLNKIYYYPLNSRFVETIFSPLSRHILTYYVIQKK